MGVIVFAGLVAYGVGAYYVGYEIGYQHGYVVSLPDKENRSYLPEKRDTKIKVMGETPNLLQMTQFERAWYCQQHPVDCLAKK
jgi:hypothetical protein